MNDAEFRKIVAEKIPLIATTPPMHNRLDGPGSNEPYFPAGKARSEVLASHEFSSVIGRPPSSEELRKLLASLPS